MKNKAINSLYKGRYFISFYELDDDTLIQRFDNVKEICIYRGLEPTQKNLHTLTTELYYALKREPHTTTMLTGKCDSIVYILEDYDDDSLLEKE